MGIVHCIGSRDENTNQWCSRVCCLYSLKLAHLIKEHTDAEVYNFYIDMRTPGKSMEEFYNRIAEEGVHIVRGKVADVFPDPSDPEKRAACCCQAEDTLLGRVLKFPVDMVVLAVGLEPQADAAGRAPHAQHELRHRGLLPRAAPQAGAGQHLHRRRVPGGLLPGPQGHPRHGGPGRGGGGGGATR